MTRRPTPYEFELLTSSIQTPAGPRGLFRGISLAAGSDARRPQPELPVNDLDDLRRMATRRRHLEELLERTEGNAAWAAQVAQSDRWLGCQRRRRAARQLADGYRATGRLDLAADTYYLLARRYPDHPLVDRASYGSCSSMPAAKRRIARHPRQTHDGAD